MRGAGVALFSSRSEIAECVFINPGKQASGLHLRAEVSWVAFAHRVWCKRFYFCLFNLCAFTPCLPFGVSLNLAFLQIPNSQQQISALPSVFFLHWHANTRKLWDSSSLWEVDAAQIPRRLRGHSCLTCPGTAGCRELWTGGKADLNPLASLHLASAPWSHKSASAAPGFHHHPDKTQLSFKCETKSRWFGEQQKQHHEASNLMGWRSAALGQQPLLLVMS